MAGISSLQGSHQLAQKFSRTTLFRKSLSAIIFSGGLESARGFHKRLHRLGFEEELPADKAARVKSGAVSRFIGSRLRTSL
ncbi:hypothetical protein D3C83_153510 [compost metagenome]